MRYVTNGNIYAPTMMLAEKSADLIRGNTPLAPINEPFYRHTPAAAQTPAATQLREVTSATGGGG